MIKVLDFYSGVGGWSLGFHLAGIPVQRSFEWWDAACETHNINFATNARPVDIRKLDLESLPKRADYVVGSPPCTQFSYSNRGGNGDIADGLVDIRRFLEVVRRLRPKAWAMENVPRVAAILEAEIAPGGSLEEFADLFSTIMIVHAEEFGLPQRRRRMLAGKFDEALLLSYRDKQPKRTLGQVVKALAAPKAIRDPIYGFSRPRQEVSGLEREMPLSAEEARMNREAKQYHPIYNVMAYPDPLNKSSRTITATCTRVSRESIVIEDPTAPGAVRRLSVRERASLQGFPISFEFHGGSHSDRLKMVGNAIPPVLTYFLAHCFLGTAAEDVPALSALGDKMPIATHRAAQMSPDKAGSRYSKDRRFQAAIPGLRFGSGMRFELANASRPDGGMDWTVRFFFGGSKKYRQIALTQKVIDQIRRHSSWAAMAAAYSCAELAVEKFMEGTTPLGLQEVWTRKGTGYGPYDLIDCLGAAAEQVAIAAADQKPVWIANLVAQLATSDGDSQSEILSAISKKFSQYDARVLAGLLIGSCFNEASAKGLWSQEVQDFKLTAGSGAR